MPLRAYSAALALIVFILIMSGATEVVETLTETSISMQEFVHSLSDHLIYLNSEIQSMYEPKTRTRRSSDAIDKKSSSLIEYVSIDCNLSCWIQTSQKFHHVLICKSKSSSPPVSMESVPVRVECTEHRSGRLLHILLSPSVKGSQADFLSDGFSSNLRNTLLSLNPPPDVLYLTIDIPIMQIRHDDFKHISVWLRRLSLFLAYSTTVDRSVLKILNLDSFKADGCDLTDTIVNKIDNACTVEFLLSCPERDFLPLIADLATHKTHCIPEQLEVNQESVSRNPRSTPSCHEFDSIMLTLKSLKLESSDHRYLLILSLWTNVILASLLILFLLLQFVFLYKGRRLNRIRDEKTSR